MLKNYFKTALRKLLRNKSYSLINLAGLSLGITCALMIFLIVRHEAGYDAFHSKRDRVFRIVTDEDQSGHTNYTQGSPFPIGEAIKKNFSDVQQVTTLFNPFGGLVAVIDKEGLITAKFLEDNVIGYVDPSFFELFDYEWVSGKPSVLGEPATAVITQSQADKYFGDADPIGKTLKLDNQNNVRIAGVIKDIPLQTDFPFQILISLESLRRNREWAPFDLTIWNNMSSNVNTYALLSDPSRAGTIESQLTPMCKKYFPDDLNHRVHHLQPLAEVHFSTDYGNFGQHATAKSTVYALALIGLFLILTACINFVNMATAHASTRAKEIGVRKVLGADRRQIVIQFLGETFLITLLSVIVSLGITELVLPKVLEIIDLQMDLRLGEIHAIGFLTLLTVLVSFAAGLYPAMILSGFVPVAALKDSRSTRSGGMILRRGLVTVQFAISQTLIIGMMVVTAQMDFFKTKDMGMNRNLVVVLSIPENDPVKLQTLHNSWAQDPKVQNISFSFTSAASGNNWDTFIRYQSKGQIEAIDTDLKFGDAEYLATYGLRLVAGRNYIPGDTIKELVVNETFLNKMGIQDPSDAIGKTLKVGKRDWMPIVGVVKDFNMSSLHNRIAPCLMATRTNTYQEAGLRISGSDIRETLSRIETIWTKAFPNHVYKMEFLDERIANFYKQEEKISDLLRMFAGIAVVIGCLGLLGLISFMAEQRTKEIGVRKVLGASVSDILIIFSKEFIALIVVAFVVAAPLAYWVMRQWLEDFEFRITIGAGVFVVSILTTIIIAGITVGYRTFKAATANPVHALKYE